jgi:hypothetical protein
MRIVLLILIMLVSAPVSFGQTAPKGWRFTDQRDMKLEWKTYVKEKKPLPYRVTADFNGGGFRDEAWILISTEKKNAVGLFVYFGPKKDSAMEVLSEDSRTRPQELHIRLLKPGNYRTSCSYGYWECGEAEPPLLRLKQSGIVYALYDDPLVVNYWSAKNFRARVCLSVKDNREGILRNANTYFINHYCPVYCRKFCVCVSAEKGKSY